jgi:hypothetical protein
MNNKPTIKLYRDIEGFRNPEDWFTDTPNPKPFPYYKVGASYEKHCDPMPILNLLILAVVIALFMLIGYGLNHKAQQKTTITATMSGDVGMKRE